MAHYNASRTMYRIKNTGLWDTVVKYDILPYKNMVVGSMIQVYGPVSNATLFSKVNAFMPESSMQQCLQALLDYKLVEVVVEQRLINKSYSSKTIVDPTNNTIITTFDNAKIEVHNVDFKSFDFENDNIINSTSIQTPKLVTQQVIEKALPQVPAIQSTAVTSEEIKLSKRVIALKTVIADQSTTIAAQHSTIQALLDIISNLSE